MWPLSALFRSQMPLKPKDQAFNRPPLSDGSNLPTYLTPHGMLLQTNMSKHPLDPGEIGIRPVPN